MHNKLKPQYTGTKLQFIQIGAVNNTEKMERALLVVVHPIPSHSQSSFETALQVQVDER